MGKAVAHTVVAAINPSSSIPATVMYRAPKMMYTTLSLGTDPVCPSEEADTAVNGDDEPS